MPDPRPVATSIVRSLRDAGHEAYFAGGCVRDEILGLAPDDYDVATSARPDDVRRAFRNVNEVGASFGVLLVRERGQVVEVATFREEGVYSDKRRPDQVRFSTAEADARRRDFTINALFLDPLEDGPPHARSPRGGRVIDHVRGLADLHGRIVRAVGDPEARLAEDHLRALRGVRLSSRLGFEIDPRTADAIARHARDLEGVSRERIGEEVRRMLMHPTRAVAAGRLQALGLDAPTLGDHHLAAPLRALTAIPEIADYPTSLAAWAMDRGAADAARRWRAALCLSNDDRDALRECLSGVAMLEGDWDRLGVAARKRAAASTWFVRALAVVRARDTSLAAAVDEDLATLRADGIGVAPAPLVTGDDLVAAGHAPGPAFKAALDGAYDDQLEGRVQDRAGALAAAERLLRHAGG